MPAGRPTDYTPELLKEARRYLNGGWRKLEHKIPSHIGLAKALNISSVTIYDWAKQKGKEEFSYILREIMDQQQLELIHNGLDSTFNSNIVKLVLGKHGFHDKSSTELTGANGGAIDMKWTVEIVDPDKKGE